MFITKYIGGEREREKERERKERRESLLREKKTSYAVIDFYNSYS